MYYVYKTTNIVNNKIYVGVHKSDNIQSDQYLGSGKIIIKSILKYGRNKFKRQILYQFETDTEAYFMQSQIVDKQFVKRKDTYNIKLGGKGGDPHVDRKDVIQGEKICPVCDKDLSGMRITDVGNHIKWCKFQSNPDNTYSQAMKKANVTRFGAFKSYKVTCNKCGTEFEVRQREHSFPKKEKYFCSISCANSRSNLSQSCNETNKGIARETSKQLWQNEQYANRQLKRVDFATTQ